MKKISLLFLFLISGSLSGIAQEVQEDIFKQLEELAIIEQKVMMPMRDGVRLATDIYRPRTEEKVPIIFERTPYNFNT